MLVILGKRRIKMQNPIDIFKILVSLSLVFLSACAGYENDVANSTNANRGGLDEPVELIGNSSEESAALAVFQRRCSQCHAAPNNFGGFSAVLDPERMQSEGYIVAGDLDNSVVFRRINNGTMPPGAPIPANEVLTVQEYVLSLSN